MSFSISISKCCKLTYLASHKNVNECISTGFTDNVFSQS